MTIYYVSNAAVNGAYVVGNDANDGLTPATAKLTIDGAITAASASDTIYVNPGGVTYSENSSGLNYLQINKANLTVRGDPTYVTAAGKPTVTSPIAGTRTINLNQAGLSLIDLKIDNAAQIRNCVFCQSFAPLTVTRCDFLNLGANAIAVTAQNSFAYNIAIDKCTLLAANGNASGTKLTQCTGSSIPTQTFSIKGCTTDTTGGLCAYGATTRPALTITSSSDGTRNTVSNATLAIQNLSGSGSATFSINHTDFTACTTAIGDGGTGTANLASLVVKNCSFNGLNGSSSAADISFVSIISDGEIAYNMFLGAHKNLALSSAAIAGLEVHDNYVNTTSMATTITNFSMSRGGAGIKFYNNRITSDTDSRLIALGGEGYPSIVTNSGGALSGDQNLGDVSGNTYIAQTFTYPANTTALYGRYLGAFDIYLKKVGSPVGTVNCYLYANSGGAPSTLIATSAYTLTSSLLTTSYQQVRFWFNSRTQLSYSTAYWIVVKYNGTIDGSNYLQWEAYTAGTAGQKSANGSSWSATSAALGYSTRQINLEMTQPQVYNNYLNATNATEIVHCIIINGADGGLVYNNEIYGGAIGVLFKDCDGSVQDLIAYNNLVSFTNSGDGACYHDKGSNNAKWYYNTAVTYSGDNKALFLEGDWNTGYLNGTPTQSAIVKNHLIANESSSGGSIIQIGNDQAKDYNVTNLTLDYNLYSGIASKTFAKVNLGQAATLTTYATLPLYQAATGYDANSSDGDALLTNYDFLDPPSEAPEFRPRYDSASVGSGVALAAPLVDYYSATRPTPPSMGGLELIDRTIPASRTIAASRAIASTRSLTTTRTIMN